MASLAESLANFIFVAFFLANISQTDDSTDSTTNVESFQERLLKFQIHFKVGSWNSMVFIKKYVFSWKNKYIGLLLLTTFFTNLTMSGDNMVFALFLKHRLLAMSVCEMGKFMPVPKYLYKRSIEC